MLAARDSITADLVSRCNAKQLQLFAAKRGVWDFKRNTKQQNAEDGFDALLRQTFSLTGSVRYSPLSGETFNDAMAKQVDAVTDEDLARYYEQCDRERTPEQKVVMPTGPMSLSVDRLPKNIEPAPDYQNLPAILKPMLSRSWELMPPG